MLVRDVFGDYQKMTPLSMEKEVYIDFRVVGVMKMAKISVIA